MSDPDAFDELLEALVDEIAAPPSEKPTARVSVPQPKRSKKQDWTPLVWIAAGVMWVIFAYFVITVALK